MSKERTNNNEYMRKNQKSSGSEETSSRSNGYSKEGDSSKEPREQGKFNKGQGSQESEYSEEETTRGQKGSSNRNG